MPLISDSAEPFGGRLLLWQLDDKETHPEAIRNAAAPLLTGIEHPLRKTQRLATCALLSLLGPNTVASLWYDTNGKPWISDPEGHISISHCNSIAVLYYHPSKKAGADVEEPHLRIARVAPRFLHPEKENWASNDKHLLQIWSAKEAVFKAIGGGGIHFKEDLHVEHPNPEGFGVVHYQGHMGKRRFRAAYRDLEGAQLVYTIAEEVAEDQS
jgi:phosphopantetheinyl transferase